MERPETQMELPDDIGKTGIGAFGRWLVRAFPWHLRGMLVGNAALSIANAFTGGPWWAFWPLLATGFLLAVHFLFCKAAAVDDRWVEERAEELNLKSYDRSHIENLKARHRGKSDPGADNRS
jgi:hypothetical protein